MRQISIELDTGKPVAPQLEQIRVAWESGTYRSLLIHVFSGLTDELLPVRVCRCVQDELAGSLVIGTMSAGEVKDGLLMPPGILVCALLSEKAHLGLLRFDQVQGREDEVGAQLRDQLDAIEHLQAAELVFPGTEINARELYRQISSCRPEVRIFGGYSGGHALNAPQHFLFDATSILPNTVLVAIYAGADLHVDVDKLIGWDALGLPFTVTKAEGNRLIELDGRPASEVYERFLQIDRKQIDNALAGYEFPLITKHNGEDCLRSAIHIDEDGALVLHGQVLEESRIHLAYGHPTHITQDVNKRLEAVRLFQPQAMLLFSCIVRKQFWGDLVNIEMRPFAELAPIAGFHTWGEVMRDASTGEVIEHNVTLLTVAFREGEPGPVPHDPVRADNTELKGHASLLSRLSNLINATMRELQTAHNDLLVLNARLTEMAERDALTGLYNRGTLERKIHGLLDAADASGAPVSLVMVDIDHFKRVNDTYGHGVGDVVLKEVARLLRDVADARAEACAGRWGGEEFFLVLPGVGRDEAYAVAEDLRSRCAQRDFGEVGRVTISLGVITAEGATDRTALFAQVDDALYAAKGAGRNRVVQA